MKRHVAGEVPAIIAKPAPNCHGWLNIYRSGYFHTPGKPRAFDRHPGDIYETKEAALADIFPRTHYVDTVEVHWYEDVVPRANAATSPRVVTEYERRELERLATGPDDTQPDRGGGDSQEVDGHPHASYLWLGEVRPRTAEEIGQDARRAL